MVGEETAAALAAKQLRPGSVITVRGTAQERNAVKFSMLPESVVWVGIACGGCMPPSLVSEHGALIAQNEDEEEQHFRTLPQHELRLRVLELDATLFLDSQFLIMNFGLSGISCQVLQKKTSATICEFNNIQITPRK